jgi:WD40 repeat protein
MKLLPMLSSCAACLCVTGVAVIHLSGAPAPGGEVPTLKTTFTGHRSHTISVAFRSDGKKVASAGFGETKKLWDVASGKSIDLEGSGGGWSIAYSPDGKTIASDGQDKAVKLWDGETGACIATLEGHKLAVVSVAFSPDGKALLSGDGEGIVKFWDLSTHKELLTLQAHTGPVRCLSFSPDKKTLATAGDGKTIKLWDFAERKCTSTLEGAMDVVGSLAFSPDGKTLASAEWASTGVRLWDLTTSKEVANFKYDDWALAVAFNANGKTLVVGTRDRKNQQTLHLIDVATKNEVGTVKANKDYVHGLAFNRKDDTMLATVGGDGAVQIWHIPASIKPQK